MADFTNNTGTAVAGRTTATRELITAPNILKWAAQGKVFEAGFGLEDSAVACAQAIDDTTANFSLQAPSDESVIVYPILARLSMVTEGGAAPTVFVMMTAAKGAISTATFTLSGTALTSKHCAYRTSPVKASQQATALYGADITVSAIAAAEYVAVNTIYLPDNMLSAAGADALTWDVYRAEVEGPHLMSSGSALLIYPVTGTSDASWKIYFKWAELTIDDLL